MPLPRASSVSRSRPSACHQVSLRVRSSPLRASDTAACDRVLARQREGAPSSGLPDSCVRPVARPLSSLPAIHCGAVAPQLPSGDCPHSRAPVGVRFGSGVATRSFAPPPLRSPELHALLSHHASPQPRDLPLQSPPLRGRCATFAFRACCSVTVASDVPACPSGRLQGLVPLGESVASVRRCHRPELGAPLGFIMLSTSKNEPRFCASASSRSTPGHPRMSWGGIAGAVPTSGTRDSGHLGPEWCVNVDL